MGHQDKCDCPGCQGLIRPDRPLPVKKILDNVLVQLSRHAEGRDLSMTGFRPEHLSMLAAQPWMDRGEPKLLELHAEEGKDGWKVWVVGAPHGVVHFNGPCLTGHGWNRAGHAGAYAKSGVVTVITPGGTVELELE